MILYFLKNILKSLTLAQFFKNIRALFRFEVIVRHLRYKDFPGVRDFFE